jgi:hypothetical protein
MANKRISSLDPLATPAVDDIIPVTDIDDLTGSPQGTTKKVTVANLVAVAPQGDLESVNNLSDLADAATARTNLGLGTAATTASTVYATAAQGTTADSAVQPTDGIEALSNVSISNPADGSILKYVSANSQYEEASLGTASTADSSDFATAAQGGLADTALQPGNSIDELGDVGTSSVTPVAGQALIWNSLANQWQPGDAGASSIDELSDVDTSSVAPTTNDFLKWGGSNWVPAVPTADVDTPLTTALRGTENPHIGAFPNQSFKVTDNPNKSVMVIADADGNLEFVTKDGANVYVNTPSSRLALAKGFSVQEDGDEPDIEAVTPSGVTYSVISGDTDTKGANGLPTRQGFNYPDIGAFPAPILISGGSIA